MIFAAALTLGLQLHPCTQGRAKAAATCGTYGVYEDRVAKSGRIIEIHVVVLKARRPSQHAIAFVAGGPGQASADFAGLVADGALARETRSLDDTYDIVLMDDRGMGKSHLLQCDFAPQSDPAVYFKQLIADSIVQACRTKLAAEADLALYNTINAVDDLDDIRAALGYPKLVLDGGSYGTFFSLVYMRRHPERVESAVLDGVDPPGFQPLPGEPIGAQTALDDLVVKCNRDAACRTHFPRFAQQFKGFIARLNRGPVEATVEISGTSRKVRMSKEFFVDRFRELLYDPEGASVVPYLIDRAANGDVAPVASVLNDVAVTLDQSLAMGAWLSYTCEEVIPFLNDADVANAAARSFAGDLRIRAQRHACDEWNVAAMPAEFNEPVRSDAPVLMISGSDDPATPPRYAAKAAAFLPNAKIVLVKGAGHATETPCVDALIVRFVRAQSARGLDVSKCSAAFTLPKFATALPQ